MSDEILKKVKDRINKRVENQLKVLNFDTDTAMRKKSYESLWLPDPDDKQIKVHNASRIQSRS